MPAATIQDLDSALLSKVVDRAFAQFIHMIWDANNRKNKQPGDPKTGGHPASCASSAHILGALHLAVREPDDYICCKPHASPVDHSLNHLMRLFRGQEEGTWLPDDEAKAVMGRLRKFSENGEPVFQSYHANTDPDAYNFLPSGSVGIPPVVSVYLALAYRYALDHGNQVPEDAHFWSLIGDSEFREGSLLECMPDAAERMLGNVTWIVDYNRQNLDGTRMPNEKGLHGRDCDRIEGTAAANGWRVIQVRHGRFREELFQRPGGESMRVLFEGNLSDYEFQLALFRKDPDLTRELVKQNSSAAADFCQGLSDGDLLRAFGDVGGHDMQLMIDTLRDAKTNPDRPTMVIVHTVKGWGLDSYADPANHNTLPSRKEVVAILESQGLTAEDPYAHFPEGTPESAYLKDRGERFRAHILRNQQQRKVTREAARQEVIDAGGLPDTFDIDTSLYPMVHTQWMWGQVAAKLVRVGTQDDGGPILGGTRKELTENETRWASVADHVLTLSPDVGTSTNIAPILDQRVYGPEPHADDVPEPMDARHPELMTQTTAWTRHIRFEIAEANCMSAAAAFGKMAFYTGHPSFPIMTVYDFFIKRALDQLYYNLYWGAEFVIMGTPSGVTLSAEGAQHSWKSDIQMPNLITWEPFHPREMEWVLADAIRRHMLNDNKGRTGVLIRAVTRSVPTKLLLEQLKRQARFKTGLDTGQTLKPAGAGADWGPALDEHTIANLADDDILASVRADCLKGAYYLVDWRGYEGYEPGDNVVHILSMGSPTTEAIAASERLLERGIFANVIAISSPELLLGILGEEDGYSHLIEGLEINADLHAVEGAGDSEAGLVSLAGRRVPIVALCDGEAGLLDNAGSIVG
ncbi:MAG: pyruvate dehydrogenase E1 component, partial [Planctomycetota bacterium]